MNGLGESLMNTDIINEQQLQNEVEKIKNQFEESKDIYREVCVLLFFRYGITPTANKLYQYVRRGSMSAPADALNKFWLELREKSRVRIERSDIPENIGIAAGDFIATLWNEAQKAAQSGFSELIDNASSEILQFKIQTDTATENTVKTESMLTETQAKLENALKRLSETDYLLLVNTQALTNRENELKALKNANDDLTRVTNEARSSFSRDLEGYSTALLKAEDRYTELERKSLLEVDRSRQQVLKLEKEIQSIRKANAADRVTYNKTLSQQHKEIANLQEKLGITSGRFTEVSKQLRSASNKLSLLESKYRIAVSKTGAK